MAKRHENKAGSLESLFIRLEELVLANSGEDEFDEVFKLLIAKLYDERKGKGVFKVHESDSETSVAVADLLRLANKEWPGVLEDFVPRLTNEHLAVCVDAFSSHYIGNESLEVMDSFFEFMVAKSAKGAKGQYFTPRHVVELCVRMMKPKANETVLDPACGSGGFLVHAFNHVRPSLGRNEVQKYCESKLWGFDLDSRAIRVAKALMILAGDGSANIIRLNSLLQASMHTLLPSEDSSLTIEDVCRSNFRKHQGFDVILTNPPFAGEVREKHILEGYQVARGKSRVERDVLFVERCVDLLREGGRMAMVLPHNKFGGESFSFLRSWLLKKARILAVVGLGRNTFLPHTHQKASVLFLQKNIDGLKPLPDYNIFFSISERDGKNSKGQFLMRSDSKGTLWDNVDHDFNEIESEFESFCSTEGLEV
jgi:type I restriction enzyme M protein